MAYYELGNALRGTFSGEFDSDQEAWTTLSKQFDEAFPSVGGRTVIMSKTIMKGTTPGGNAIAPESLSVETREAIKNWEHQ